MKIVLSKNLLSFGKYKQVNSCVWVGYPGTNERDMLYDDGMWVLVYQ